MLRRVIERPFNTPRLPGTEQWEYADLLALRERYGLRLEAIENLPNSFYERCMLGLPGREQELEHVRATIGNMGRAGIRVLGFHFMPGSVWRTSLTAEGRAGGQGQRVRSRYGRGSPASTRYIHRAPG